MAMRDIHDPWGDDFISPWGDDFIRSTDEVLKRALVAWIDANPTISEQLVALTVEEVVQAIFFERTSEPDEEE